jgi:hypothetical protein
MPNQIPILSQNDNLKANKQIQFQNESWGQPGQKK